MNILIVDDEASAIEAVMKHVRWDKLPFFDIFTATNKTHAIQIIQQHEIDFLLCDIEMPMGSGLELLQWVNENGKEICCIFMTCHADFDYAQKAIRLGSYDYILKPLNFEMLEEVLQKAAHTVNETRTLKQTNSYWQDSLKDISKQFWKDLFSGDIAPSKDSIEHYWEQKHSDFSIEKNYFPILVSIKHWEHNISRQDQKLVSYAIRNMAEELFAITDAELDVLPFSDNHILVMFCLNKEVERTELTIISEACHKIASASKQHLNTIVCCYIGKPADVCDIPDQLETLQVMDFNHVMFSQNPISLNELDDYRSLEREDRDFKTWLELLQVGQYERIQENIRKTLSREIEKYGIDRRYLGEVYREFYLLLFEFTHKYNIFMSELFSDEKSVYLLENAAKSLDVFLEWTAYALRKLSVYEKENMGETDPVQKIKKFIQKQLAEELSVEDIANHVHLNADYLNRIFKRRENVSIGHYIIQQKMNRAEWLLHNSKHSIGEIAAMVGYFNYSNFNRNFANIVGMSPQEYKNQLK